MPKVISAQMMPLKVSDAAHRAVGFGVCSLGLASCSGPVVLPFFPIRTELLTLSHCLGNT